MEKLKRRKSKYKGVSWNTNRQRWAVNIRVDGKQKSFGHFRDEEEACRKYDIVAITLGKPTNKLKKLIK